LNLNLDEAFKKVLFFAFIFCCAVSFAYAQGDVYLSLSATGKRSDIAIESFFSPNKQQDDIKYAQLLKEIVQNDLILCRYFNVVIGDPEANAPLDTKLVFWEKKGAAVLLNASVKTLKPEQISVDVKLYDVVSGEIILKQNFRNESVNYRYLAHEISDEIVKRFTGEIGVACSRIAFINNSTRFKELYLIDYDGYNLRRLTKDKKLNILPRWSPDGEQIIYTSYLYNNPDLFSLNVVKNRRSIISKYQGLNAAGAFSPDGKKILLTLSRGKYPNLYLISPTGEILRRMTDGSYIDTSPSFAPNGQEIVFISDRPGYPQLYIMNIDGGNLRRLTTSGFCDSPAWSPRGDKIVFTMRQQKGNYDLFVYDLPSSKITRLTNNQRNNENPSWSPDGRFLAFSSTRSGRSEIYVMAIDGSGTRKLAELPESSYTPAWSPNLLENKQQR
jgi:TolB protein